MIKNILKSWITARGIPMKRLKLAAKYSTGNILDVGITTRQNPYLSGSEVIGFDIQEQKNLN